jgi:lysyl-tRNA synthetase class 2
MQANDLREARLEKLKKIKELRWNPYAPSYEKTHSIKEVLANEGNRVKTAVRITSFREHGNIAFADLKDETGKIQIFFQKKLLGEEYKNIRLLDIGDFIGVEGEVGKTVAGEISILPDNYILLSKATLPLPSEWFGIKDIETRYRQRYLDLILNDQSREIFNIRTKLISGVREYLDNLGFWEVETPTLQLLYGGANAKPFKTHMNALGQDVYLRIADELYLKRLIVGGYERVYEIAKDFRNEGIDHTHFPEFTMIEWYEAYADYQRVMDVAEGLFKHLANKIYGRTTLKIDDKEIDIGNDWPRIEMTQILKDKLGLDVESETRESLENYIKENCQGTQLAGGESKGQLIFAIFEHKIPSLLDEPTWIIDYPEEVSPLAKQHRSKPGWVERFEGYIGGKEIADGWSELTDPAVQRERLTADSNAIRKDKEEAQHVDEDFLEAMEYGMPPLGGIGIGIDRLTMFLTNKWAIKEVVLFPTLKAEAPASSESDE